MKGSTTEASNPSLYNAFLAHQYEANLADHRITNSTQCVMQHKLQFLVKLPSSRADDHDLGMVKAAVENV